MHVRRQDGGEMRRAFRFARLDMSAKATSEEPMAWRLLAEVYFSVRCSGSVCEVVVVVKMLVEKST